MCKVSKIIGILPLLVCVAAFSLRAQEMPMSPQEREAKIYEAIEKSVEDYTESLKLQDWQVFYVDSILTHNQFAMDKEMTALQNSKVSNVDIYIKVQDEWMQKTYDAFHKVFDESQWARYLKMGAAREQKARDKRKK